jgi:hypothetical protein
MEAADSLKIIVTLYHTTWPHILKINNCHIHCHETHKSHTTLGTLQNWCLGQLHDAHKSGPVPCTVSCILWINRRQDSYPYPRTSNDTLKFCILSYVSKKHFQCIADLIILWVLCYDQWSAGQSVLEQSTHLGLMTRSLLHVWQLRSCSCGEPSLTRGRVCPLYMIILYQWDCIYRF